MTSTTRSAVTNVPVQQSKTTDLHSAANKKEETVLSQRQRLRKIGPFAVDSQSIPDSRTKYAGSWAPPCYESDSEANQAAAAAGLSGQKQPVKVLPLTSVNLSITFSRIFSRLLTRKRKRFVIGVLNVGR